MHNSEVYVVGPDEPPERKYEVGLRYLENGMPRKAHDLIAAAFTKEHDSSEIRFHWVLALLSKRSFRDVSSGDHEKLRELWTRLHTFPEDAWRRALESLSALLECLDDPDADPEPAVDAVLELPSEQRELIVHHLGAMVTGGAKAKLWQQIVQDAVREATDNGRRDRAWSYFEPTPAGARARKPKPNSTNVWDGVGTAIWGSLLLMCAAGIGWTALAHGGFLELASCVLALVAGYLALRNALLWWHRNRLCNGGTQTQFLRPLKRRPPPAGFADRVDQDFRRYFIKYAPDRDEWQAWLEETEDVRRTLRDEVVHIYREKEVDAGSVKWLIRHMARDVRDRSSKDLPLDPRPRHEAGRSVRKRTWLFSVIGVVAMLSVIASALLHAPVITVVCLLGAGVSSRYAVSLWANIVSESWRVREERAERKRILQERQEEYERWTDKLASLRPTESEMETWLNADKTLILRSALIHHQLSWHEIVAHTFLQTSDESSRRAKEKYGAWRYSKYVIRLFLITQEGVRDVEARLNFNRGLVGKREFGDYRFDSVSSVHVVEQSRINYTLYLTLTNGDPQKIDVFEPSALVDERAEESGEDEDEVNVNLDASGFSHTRRILEGIAAEGKSWITRDQDQRERKRTAASTAHAGQPGVGGEPKGSQTPERVSAEH
ncbi:hypothetical protein IDM40_21995 [Nocardiopsis sp. HNM0947]|uniref:Uncharacterized protein n=1 Tax=Nocardiopsis coralli TaxID=2772213 RepID=A0ABR9PBW9_9ACTN|nr:hypothetical protein [Nocardiopsis coralli]MBE3001343.1 hypothetical protein [Nocardiopsis coralli]